MANTINADNGVSSGSAGLKSSSDGTGILALQTNGTTAVTVDASQNVGIGTSSPSYKLDVRGTLAVLDGSSNIGFYANGSLYTQIWQTLQSTNDFIIQTTASKYMSFGTNSTERMRIDSSGNVGIGTSSPSAKLNVISGSVAQLIIGFSGTSASYLDSDLIVFRSAATTERMRIDSSGVITSGLGGMQVISGTSVTASGTSVNFTSIPSWVKRITVMFSGVSTNGTSNLLLQIGDSGGIENTGYTSCAQTDGGSSTVISSGFAVVYGVTAAGINSGRIEISLITGTTWVASGVVGNNGGNVSSMFGNKALSDVLDRVRITTVNGTDTFDAGTINILYE